jgi:hypothetical protein
MWRKRNLGTLLVGIQAGANSWKNIWRFLKNLNMDLSCDPAIPLLGIYPKQCDTCYSKCTCTPMFIVVYSQQPSYGKNQGAPLLTKGSRKCAYTQWNFNQPWRKMKSYHLHVNGWSWRTSFWESLAIHRRPKIICSPSYVIFRSRVNTTML